MSPRDDGLIMRSSVMDRVRSRPIRICFNRASVTFHGFSRRKSNAKSCLLVRVSLFSIKILGWLVAHTPELLLRGVAAALGDAIFFFLPRRRRLVISNLHHAFPEKSPTWRRQIGRES